MEKGHLKDPRVGRGQLTLVHMVMYPMALGSLILIGIKPGCP